MIEKALTILKKQIGCYMTQIESWKKQRKYFVAFYTTKMTATKTARR